MLKDLMRGFYARLKARFPDGSISRRAPVWRRKPELFAKEALGSKWWSGQQLVAKAIAANRRTVVKSANGVGKTYLAADLALWFLYSHSPAIVLTTAPTRRQVENLLWQEIRRRLQSAKLPLPGRLSKLRLDVGPGCYAIGLATDEGVKFQGFHAENLFVIFDEASGIPDEIWEAAEGIAVGGNNRILAIGNPLCNTGRFHQAFREGSGWKTFTLSAFDHPNMAGKGQHVPGAVTREAIEARVAEWCEEATGTNGADVFVWRGRRYMPNNAFRSRVLGVFPDAEADSLIAMKWIDAAMERTLPAAGVKYASADIARFGVDSTVIGVRTGAVVTSVEIIDGADLMEVAERIAQLAYNEHPDTIAVDSVGIGAGVVDRLNELGIDGIAPINAGLPAQDTERFLNRRAEMYWNLRERFRTGEIAMARNQRLREELAAIRYNLTSRGQIKIESKDEMKSRGMHSPDCADMLAMLFDPGTEWAGVGQCLPHRENALESEMHGW